MARGSPVVTVEAVAERIRGTFPGEIGVEPLELTDELARGRLRIEERHLHPGGFVHGGVVVTLADTVAAWGTIRHLSEDQFHTTVEMKVNLFGPARLGDALTATGVPLHVGKRTQVWEVRVEREGDLRASFTCTQMVLDRGG